MLSKPRYFRLCGLLYIMYIFYGTSFAKKPHNYRVYHGLIGEDAQPDDEVELDHPLRVLDWNGLTGDTICGYTVYKAQSDVPFKVVLLDSESRTGEAKLLLADGNKLNFEEKEKYHFDVAAYDCVTHNHTDRMRIHVSVVDTNEFAPEWINSSYTVEVDEGQMIVDLLHLEATDEDGSPEYSAICYYHILTTNVPFSIDARGVLSNTEPLEYKTRHNYILEVKAEDCGGKESRTSDKLMVNVLVKEVCKPAWKDIPEQITFTPINGRMAVLNSARLDLCDQQCGPQQQISTHIQLEPDQSTLKGCDRNSYFVHWQRQFCGASGDVIDLLPRTSLSGYLGMNVDDGSAPSDEIYSFDGATNAIEYPLGENKKLNHSLGALFTMAAWMKHKQPNEANDSGATGESKTKKKKVPTATLR